MGAVEIGVIEGKFDSLGIDALFDDLGQAVKRFVQFSGGGILEGVKSFVAKPIKGLDKLLGSLGAVGGSGALDAARET